MELEGTLVASENLSYLVNSDTPDFWLRVLLPEGLIDRLTHLHIPLSGESSVNFVGYATFICDVRQTGHHIPTFRMNQVYSFTYEDKYVGRHSFHVSHMQ